MKKKWCKKYTVIIVLMLVVLGAAGCYGVFFSKTFSIKETTYVYIGKDKSLETVMQEIENKAHPGTLWGFKVLHQISGRKIHTGRYAVKPEDCVLTLYRKITSGQQTPVKFTLPSVRTLDKLAGAIHKKLMLDSAALAKDFQDSAFCARYGYDTTTLACLFIPNTYEMYWNITLDDFMKKMVQGNKTFWNNNNRKELAEKLGMTPEEVITLASIVEEETANDSEKPAVAGMYLNRLASHMPLQADPTIKFALKDFSLRRIYHKHLTVESPYNTYKYEGLPPGPIRIPSVATIDAVLHRQEHDYLYMCAKEDFSGTHNFAKTYTEHLQNAQKYTQALNQRHIQ